MMMSPIGKVLVLFAVLSALASPQWVSAEGSRGGFDDAFGPRFHPESRQDHPKSKHRPRHGFDRVTGVRHWNQIAVDASGLDHTPVALGRPACSANNLGQVARLGRWPSSILPSSKSSMLSKETINRSLRRVRR
jgi:hypothetical protein